MVTFQNVSYGYSKNRALFEDLCLKFESGHIYGLLGKNGAGKTTLLRLMSGLLFPKEGTIEFDAVEPRTRKPQILEKIFFIPEEFEMPRITPIEYGRSYGVFYPLFDIERYLWLLSELEVDSAKSMHTMSFGQKKKSMIAFALACNTPLLIMDEPTNGMDIPAKAAFRRVVASMMDENRTIIISTHQVRDLEQLIDSVTILDRSQILTNASMEQITQKLKFKHIDQGEKAIFSEQTPHGQWGVTLNYDGEESQVDMELLFNAAMTDKQFFLNNLVNK